MAEVSSNCSIFRDAEQCHASVAYSQAPVHSLLVSGSQWNEDMIQSMCLESTMAIWQSDFMFFDPNVKKIRLIYLPVFVFLFSFFFAQ